jgi:hypothetical protein
MVKALRDKSDNEGLDELSQHVLLRRQYYLRGGHCLEQSSRSQVGSVRRRSGVSCVGLSLTREARVDPTATCGNTSANAC